MAADSCSVSKQSISGKKRVAKCPPHEESKPQKSVISSPGKRNKSPRIQLVGGGIYDAVNGKTCHQCRQKTQDIVAACKSPRNNKSCPLMYCRKCLLNRYGEKAEEAVELGEWSCPRCRGICNCSICMKKRGHHPTGILKNAAKATGYSSVSEMLLKGTGLLNKEKVVCTVTSLKKDPLPGKENTFGGNVDANLPNLDEKKSNEVKEAHEGKILHNISPKIIRSPDKRKENKEILGDQKICSIKLEPKENCSRWSKDKLKKTKRDRSDETSNSTKNGEEILKGSRPLGDEKNPKKPRKEKLGKDGIKNDATLERSSSLSKLKARGKKPKEGTESNAEFFNTKENANERVNVVKKAVLGPMEKYIRKEDTNAANKKTILKPEDAGIPADIPLAVELLNSVAGIDLQAEDVGNALQFLQFCAVFGKMFEVKRGQPEYVLQDIFHGRTGRRGKVSVTVQFHMKLLSLLLKENGKGSSELGQSHGKNSWFHALKKCLSKSQCVLKALGLESLEKTADYDTLTAPEKLRLLNMLSDEVLGTEKLRNWMDGQNARIVDKVKDAKQKILAAKDKEKHLRQKMKDDIAQAILAKHGAPLSISEHEAIASGIKSEMEQVQAEMLKSKGALPKMTKISDAVRTEPILVGSGGNAYWKLHSYDQSAVFHQNIGYGDSLTLDEQWSTIDDEGKEVIEKHICYLRGKRIRALRRLGVSTLN